MRLVSLESTSRLGAATAGALRVFKGILRLSFSGSLWGFIGLGWGPCKHQVWESATMRASQILFTCINSALNDALVFFSVQLPENDITTPCIGMMSREMVGNQRHRNASNVN